MLRGGISSKSIRSCDGGAHHCQHPTFYTFPPAIPGGIHEREEPPHDPDRTSRLSADLAYCWDGTATAYGVLQFGAQPAAAMNIQRVFHRAASIHSPLCPTRRYEYLATGTFLDAKSSTIPLVFSEVESAAQYVDCFILYFQIAHPQFVR